MRRLLLLGLILALTASDALAQSDGYGFVRGAYPKIVYSKFWDVPVPTGGPETMVASFDIPPLTAGRALRINTFAYYGFSTTGCTLKMYLSNGFVGSSAVITVTPNTSAIGISLPIYVVGLGPGLKAGSAGTTAAATSRVLVTLEAPQAIGTAGTVNFQTSGVAGGYPEQSAPASHVFFTITPGDAPLPTCVWHGAVAELISDGQPVP